MDKRVIGRKSRAQHYKKETEGTLGPLRGKFLHRGKMRVRKGKKAQKGEKGR